MMAFTYMQEAIIRDRNGNTRCPFCGKYRRRDDFSEQDAAVGSDIRLELAPACKWCLGLVEGVA